MEDALLGGFWVFHQSKISFVTYYIRGPYWSWVAQGARGFTSGDPVSDDGDLKYLSSIVNPYWANIPLGLNSSFLKASSAPHSSHNFQPLSHHPRRQMWESRIESGEEEILVDFEV